MCFMELDTFDDDAPTLTQADFDRARWRVGNREVSRAEWQALAKTYSFLSISDVF